jgi:hypothetical protein
MYYRYETVKSSLSLILIIALWRNLVSSTYVDVDGFNKMYALS